MSFDFRQGELPLLISFPHSGVEIPEEISKRMTSLGKQCPDTDWWLPELYDFPEAHGTSQIRANFSRYVIDPNRPPDGANLYPGKPTPALCPIQTFSGEPIYLPGEEPSDDEILERRSEFWEPYHARIVEELANIKDIFGYAILFDAHSILSRVPRLFEGQLPDLNIGTCGGGTCDAGLQDAIEDLLKEVGSKTNYSHVINGRFIGGYITRHYGSPQDQVHAVQLELSQVTYMNESDTTWNHDRAHFTRHVLQDLIQTILDWSPQVT